MNELQKQNIEDVQNIMHKLNEDETCVIRELSEKMLDAKILTLVPDAILENMSIAEKIMTLGLKSNNVIEELVEYKEFKRNFRFTQKEIIQIGEDLFCEDALVLAHDAEKPEGSSEKWVNVGYKLKGPFSKVLSNLFPYEIYFRDKKLSSIESFFQGIKFKDVNMQNYVFKYSGLDSNNIKVASDFNWKEEGTVYWQETAIKRNSKEYDDLVDELYISAIQNPLYRNALKNCEKEVIHSMGENQKTETVFTRYEFEYQINCLRAFVQMKG